MVNEYVPFVLKVAELKKENVSAWSLEALEKLTVSDSYRHEDL